LSAARKTKEALFAGFFRFLFLGERLFGSLFRFFCMIMQKKGKVSTIRKEGSGETD